MEVLSPTLPNAGSNPTEFQSADPLAVLEHIASLIQTTLGAARRELESVGSLLSRSNYDETLEKCTRFSSETEVALYAQKDVVQDDGTVNGHDDNKGPAYVYSLSSDFSNSSTTVGSLAFLKPTTALDARIHLSEQIHVVNLPGLAPTDDTGQERLVNISPFEILHSVVHNALGPYFDAYTKNRDALSGGRTWYDPEAKTGISGARKRIAELEMSLLHLQQNTDIPMVQLPLHIIIQQALQQAEADGRTPTIQLMPKEVIDDSTVMNSIQNNVIGWIKSIQALTRLTNDAECGSAAQEISFWISLESALKRVDQELENDGIQLTLNVLKAAKRHQAFLSFNTDTGLKDAIDLVRGYNQLMRDFPLDELSSATSLIKVQEALVLIFSHLNKKLKISFYPVKRALKLVEGISEDLDSQLHRLLRGRSVMRMDYQEFLRLVHTANDIWSVWEDQVKDFTNVARDVTKRRAAGTSTFVAIKIVPRHIQTKERLAYVNTFRTNHEQLQRTIVNVLGTKARSDAFSKGAPDDGVAILDEIGDVDAAEEVANAYHAIQDVDVLDISPRGTELWVQAELLYNERTARIENSIIARLRDRLATAKTANEMFRVFSKFNALLVRPKVRGAIGEYQTQLLENVKHDISMLHERFKQQYGDSEAQMMAQLHDLPPVAGSILWVRQIEGQLNAYMKKVEAVLGEDWKLHTDGEKLQAESELFRKKLTTRNLYEAWQQDVLKRKLTITGRLFNISRVRGTGDALEISVNFDTHIISLFKEVRNLTWLNYQVPHQISSTAKEAKRVYPYALSLMESVTGYLQTSRAIHAMPDVSDLMAGYEKDVQTLIAKGLPLKWETIVNSYEVLVKHNPSLVAGSSDSMYPTVLPDSKHVQFIRDLAVSVANLQSKTTILTVVKESVGKALSELKSCTYSAQTFQTHLDTIQTAVDKLNLENYSNLAQWVARLNTNLEETLQNRMKDALRHWTRTFTYSDNGNLEFAHQPHSSDTYAVNFPAMVVEIMMNNQTIYLDPPLNFAKASWLQQLESWLDVLCDLDRIKSSRYQISTLSAAQTTEIKFNSLPLRCLDELRAAYNTIDDRILSMTEYVTEWFRYQSLWDLRPDDLQDNLGVDLGQWHQLLQEIRVSRSTFDTSEVRKRFGNVTFDYEQVQSKITQKYDQWQQDITARFGNILGMRMREVYADLKRSRSDLESQSLEASSTAQAVAFITVVQQCRRSSLSWEPEVDTFRQGQTTLSRQRYNFPPDWLPATQVGDEWDAFQDILDRKSKIVAEQSDALQAKIVAEDGIIAAKINDVIAQWTEEKPVSGAIPPDEASALLRTYRGRLEKLQSESDTVLKAKEALGLPTGTDHQILATALEEVQDFMSVWSALSTVWQNLNELRDSLWSSVQPRKVRQSLDGLVKMTKEMPSRMRQYAAFEHVQNVLRQLLKCSPILADLKSDAIRERHWIKVFKALRPQKRYSETSMTLGDVWDLQLITSETIVREIIQQASGELGLEEYIRQVRDTWQSYALELVNYQNRNQKLIRGWDDLFTKCSENLNFLQQMRHSPYYKEFEEEASAWEDKLNRVHVLFDVWIDVQRQWVYLEGVFTNNNDIKHLLPTESSRFSNINAEFNAVMKKVAKAPFVLEVLSIPGVQKSLERLAELLSKIQKALGEYLERERVSFPRFYFVGDEDLLEIIGNSNDTLRIAKHFKKMFAGLSGVEANENNTIVAVSSREGEQVRLRREVSLVKLPRINEWLAALETSVKLTLAELLSEAIEVFGPIFTSPEIDSKALNDYLSSFPAQIVVLASQVVWTRLVHLSLENGGQGLEKIWNQEVALLQSLADSVLQDLTPLTRRKCEHLITESVHQRDVLAKLQSSGATSPGHYMWLLQMRYVYEPSADIMSRLSIEMANAKLEYGYEYLGVPDRLVRTPLTDRCFLTLTQALAQRLGGSPYGPAGTGKTESVKALGLQLGRFTLVFCCDDTFDFQAMGRIFLGICQVGAWGCFDEFNRLEERILSAVSQQIQNIQIGLRNSSHEQKAEIDLVGRKLRVNQNSGLFITMNPGYAGRSNLPDNLKKLFRSVAMSKPDKELIAEVMLFSQGFKQAKTLSVQAVPFFDHCAKRLSKQPHYDFGLRALKSVLISSGGLKRGRTQSGAVGSEEIIEPQIIVQSIRDTVAPKLIKDDVERLIEIQHEDFPGVEYVPADLSKLKQAIQEVMKERHLTPTETWMTKILQLYQIQNIHHGVMMVGPSGSGKSQIWKVLLQALQKIEGIEGVSHVIDPKVMSKEALYGSLDSTTREWTDGLFTATLRKIVDNLRGEDSKRHWIVFDGDVDPEWVENLNSVLDDNKLLTLPNGERLNLPSNVRIMFEVQSLKYATLATVSRCGMVWFSDDTVTSQLIIEHSLQIMRRKDFEDLDDESNVADSSSTRVKELQGNLVDTLGELLYRDDFLLKALDAAEAHKHIMEFTVARALNSLFSLLAKSCRTVLEYYINHTDFPLDDELLQAFISKKMLLAVVWALVGDCSLSARKDFGNFICAMSNVDLPRASEASLIDYDVQLPQAQWIPWQSQVPSVELNTHSIIQTDVIVPTVDTVRHEDVLYSWLAEHKPLLLCGPPGSGKTMTLFSALRKLPDMEVVGLNFSSATQPDLIVKTFEQYCEYKKTLNGVVMSPTQIGRWLVVFCDEINLPAPDKYGTQRAISFLRQLVEQNGFYRTTDKAWVSLERIQFVGACNPPTDAGRHSLGPRFLRHAPVVMVDYPGELSLMQIYGAFNIAILKIIPQLRGFADALTKAMVQFYLRSQTQFTPDIQPHYVYSPRELTRWARGLYEAIKPLEQLSLEGLVRIWAHEALRLFQDRLVEVKERTWTLDMVRETATEYFPSCDIDQAMKGPILFSNWLSKNYVSVEQEQLREFVKARLKTFCEEEVDVPLVLFNDVLEHALRIDRVFRQPQGHLILIGTSGSGKTTLSRFVAWMNGLNVFQIKVHGKYSAQDFDDDLREVLRACGCRGQKICFIMDESNVLDSGFLERMNTLLANGEVPGLFEGDDYSALMTACKEGAQRQGLLLDSQEELYKWFTQQVVRNLHVVFTMNPPQEGLSSKAATSPALFNRCVLNWMGDWSDQALYQVGFELTQSIDLDKANFTAPDSIPVAYQDLALPASHRDAIVNAMVFVHHSVHRTNLRLEKQQGRLTYLTPRHYLDFVAQFVKLFHEKREDLEDQQRHLNVGLEKLRDTVDKVSDLRASLAQKKKQLEQKDAEANEKLQRMVADQRETETRKSASLEIQTTLERQEREVSKRKQIVLGDLAKAEPAVIEAQRSVSNIKRQHLTEVRSMANPPGGVKLALESVCTLLGNKPDSWKTIQSIVRREDFIASIVNYDNEQQMTPNLRTKMRNEYLSNEDFTYERVNRASKACGPLVQWVHAQVNYSEILDRVGPLRAEVEQLEDKALQTKAEAKAIENTIAKLEDSIATYKVEYAALISETQAIKAEMSRVQQKVDRSVRLLDSLSSERVRWEAGSKSFETQIQTLVGDVVIASAFLAYAGFYDQQFRKGLIDDWLHQLSESGIACKTESILGYMSTADERLQWQRNSLPVDDLCTENAIMLQRFNRYPLIIDPSSRATEFLKQEHQGRKLTVTSFLDDSFIKQLESALRFGNPILIQDAEYLDPILNHVLNKEYQKTGGRVLIQLGKQEIDFSPSFKLYLSTRDPSAFFAPDVCSRTTFINFTVTQSSLKTQSLNDVLKSERPDVDRKRTNLVKMQGEFNKNLRLLEKKLLQALNESRGNILDDDNVIQTLETLKKEAAVISRKVAETDGVMAEVERITREYSQIAQACSAIFATLELLHHLNHAYHFSLQYFVDIFNSVLHENKRLTGKTNHAERSNIILHDIFVETYRRTSLSLLQKDRITLAMLLVRATPYEIDMPTFDLILEPENHGYNSMSASDSQKDIVAHISHLPPFQKQAVDIRSKPWRQFLEDERAERCVPTLWKSETSPIDQELYKLLLIKLARPDRFLPAAESFVNAVFGPEIFHDTDNLSDIVRQVTASTPIALSSNPGFDASYKVDALVERQGATCANTAMGSNESVASADKAISSAAANGTWVLVKNVHLAPQWLQSLEKRLSSLKPHEDFRLFLSMELNPRIPVNLIRACRSLVYEQPAGIRANMKDTLSVLSERGSKAPAEKSRIYFLLCFLHAVLQERLRYAPTLGWKGLWEFNDSDYECCAFIIDTWVDSIAQGRSNVAPSKFPWDLLRTLVAEMYGGKIDDEEDFATLGRMVNKILDPGAYETEYVLVPKQENGQELKVPAGTTIKDFSAWVDKLPEREPPTYLGLPANAEKVLLIGRGRDTILNLAKITEMLEEGEHVGVDADADVIS